MRVAPIGAPVDAAVRRAAAAVGASEEARRTLALGDGHVDPLDIVYCTDVDRFDFAMEVDRTATGPRLVPTWPER